MWQNADRLCWIDERDCKTLRVMTGIMEQGGPNFRLYKMLFHELHKAYEALKKTGEELLDEEEK